MDFKILKDKTMILTILSLDDYFKLIIDNRLTDEVSVEFFWLFENYGKMFMELDISKYRVFKMIHEIATRYFKQSDDYVEHVYPIINAFMPGYVKEIDNSDFD